MKKTNTFLICSLLIIGMILIFQTGCNKDDSKKDTPTGTVTDIDSNVYHTKTIGSQVWMIENLKTTHYCNGDPIKNVTSDSLWGNLTTEAYCNYFNDVNHINPYGRLYNWYAVNDSRKIAPAGWHVATDADWTKLTNYLGDESVAGGKLKETGTTHWFSSNAGATNETGFTALPGGYRDFYGKFDYLGASGRWWTSTQVSATAAWSRGMEYRSRTLNISGNNKSNGYSVRCVKD